MQRLVSVLNKFLARPFSYAGILLARDKWLCAQLLWMAQRDQQIRSAFTNRSSSMVNPRNDAAFQRWSKQLRHLDQRHTSRMKQTINRHGWPGYALVGPIGAEAAWLLVQHADHDCEFQKRCQGLLEAAVQNQQASPQQLAYLSDRIRVAEGKPQLYGTQFHGASQPLPN
jgi:hypothetical protein